MAEAKLKKGTFTVRNIAPGVRGFHDHKDGYLELEPGKSASEVVFTEAEFESALATKAFEITAGDAPAADEEPDQGGSDADGLPETKAELEKLATAEGIDPTAIQGTGANGNVVKADIAAAIQAARAAKAAGGTNPTDAANNAQPGDTLDKMSDADLRDTVKALTGEEPAADLDRAALLKLARGEA